MSHAILYLDNDNEVELNNLRIAGSTSPSTGATVTAEIKSGETLVCGTSNPITLSGTSGDYQGTLQSTDISGVSHNSRVKIHYSVTSSSGADSAFVKEAVFRQRSV